MMDHAKIFAHAVTTRTMIVSGMVDAPQTTTNGAIGVLAFEEEQLPIHFQPSVLRYNSKDGVHEVLAGGDACETKGLHHKATSFALFHHKATSFALFHHNDQNGEVEL